MCEVLLSCASGDNFSQCLLYVPLLRMDLIRMETSLRKCILSIPILRDVFIHPSWSRNSLLDPEELRSKGRVLILENIKVPIHWPTIAVKRGNEAITSHLSLHNCCISDARNNQSAHKCCYKYYCRIKGQDTICQDSIQILMKL